MAMNRKVKLFDEVQGYGTSGKTKTNEKTVWCEVVKSFTKTKATALSVNVKLSQRLLLWKKEYDEQNRCVFDGVEYAIASTSDADNDKQIILLLERS